MSRRDVRAGERSDYAVAPPSRCAKVLYYTWKLCSVLFSHLVMISLVVAYCILGAVTFEKLEAEHEKEVKNNISQIRSNTTLSIWSMTRAAPLLNHTSWTEEVVHMLKDFESSILHEMKMRGWDGNESTDHIQWTFTGALFYSIIVITTIGYGHIAPKTQTGKVVTIFYAILGIPLMLLCLSNIGDVMATSFRFLYWRVCCYVCTRPPKRRRRHHAAGAARRSVRGRNSSTRRKRPALERAHSDTDFRYRDSGYSSGRARRARPAPRAPSPRAPRTRSQPPPHMIGSEDIREDRSPARYNWAASHRTPLDNEEYYPKASLPLQDLAAALKDLDDHSKKVLKNESRSKSLPRPAKQHSDYGPRKDWDDTEYDLGERDKNMFVMHDLHDVDYENFREKKALEERSRRMREKNGEPEGYRDRGYDPEDDDFEFDSPRHRRNFTLDNRRKDRGRSEFYERDRDDNDYSRRYQHERRAKSAAVYEYGQRWVDDHERERDRWPDVEGGKGRRLRRLQTVDDSYRYENRYSPSPPREDWSDDELPPTRRSRPSAWDSRQLEMYPALPEPSPKEEIKPVPIWLCVLLVGSYIVAGTFLFKRWESWAYLDSAYFCFITLTTIGFGDFVPAQGQSGDPASAVHSIALCSLYLLFGIALLAMSFNLVQEEVRANVAALATSLGIIKPQRTGSETDDDY